MPARVARTALSDWIYRSFTMRIDLDLNNTPRLALLLNIEPDVHRGARNKAHRHATLRFTGRK